jgi:hypothetical protein
MYERGITRKQERFTFRAAGCDPAAELTVKALPHQLGLWSEIWASPVAKFYLPTAPTPTPTPPPLLHDWCSRRKRHVGPNVDANGLQKLHYIQHTDRIR